MSEQPVPRPDRTSQPRTWARVIAPVAAVGLGLGGFAIAQAATGSDSADDVAESAASTTSTTSTSLPDLGPGSGESSTDDGTVTFLPDALADGTTQTFAAGAAGTVTISRNGSLLTVVATSANPGFTAHVETAMGPQVEVEFTGTTTRIDLEAELEDGAVRVRVRERALDEETEDDADDAAEDPADDHDAEHADNSGPGSTNSGGDTDDRHGDDGYDGHEGSGNHGSDDDLGNASGPSGSSHPEDR